MPETIKVAVNGAFGRMGREVVKAVLAEQDMQLAGICDSNPQAAQGLPETNLPMFGALADMLDSVKPEVVVDFTSPMAVFENAKTILQHGARPVIGTTGLTADNLEEIESICKANNTGALVAPNFAIGAVLMMKFASEAAKYMPQVEIIELHHDKKLDAPSGTAIKTAEMIAANRPEPTTPAAQAEAARGGSFSGIQVHSIRLPGLVAHQEVIFGGLGQTLTIRHDSLDRQSFMPGVIIAIRYVRKNNGLVYGLEKIL